MPFLRLLGGPSLCGNGSTLTGPATQKHRLALLALLASSRSRPQSRDKLVAWLWPERDVEHARNLLNQGVHALRRAIGEAAIVSTHDELRLDSAAVVCDVVAFEDALAAGELERAIGLYTGPFLDGFHLPGASEFEHWADGERDRLRRSYARSLESLAEAAEERREWSSAVERWRGLVSEEPYNARVTLRLMRALDAAGDRAGALQQARLHTLLLQQEFEAGPDPDVVALAERLRTERTNGNTREVAVPPPNTGSDGRLPHAGTSPPARVTTDRFASTAELARTLDEDPSLTTIASSTPSPAVAVDQPLGGVGRVAPGPTVGTPPPRASVGRRRPGLRALGLVVLGAFGTMIWALRPAPPVAHRATVSPTTLAILPFAYQGSQEFAYLGEGMMDLLSASLNGAGEVRTVDPDAVLALFRQVGGDRLEPEQARNLAARLGAGSYILGNVVETGGHLRISARFHSGDQKEGGGQTLVDGRSLQLFQLVDQLTAQLIAQQSGGPAGALPRLAAMTTDSLAALKAYLEAERHFRAWRLDSTIQAAQRAIRIDSSFALAHYRLATALLWADGGHAGEAVDRALRHSHRLSPRDRRLIEALAAFVHGRIREAGRIYREIVARNPDDLEATFQLADLIHSWSGHLGSSWLDARELFERLLAIDPSHHDAHFHLSLIAARERRLEELDSLTDRLLADRRVRKFPPPGSSFFRGQRAVAFGDTAEIARFMADLRKSSDDIAQWTGGAVVHTTGDLVVGRRIWRLFTEPSRSRGLRVLAHLTLAKLELMTGRWSAAKVEIDSAMALDSATALEHRALLSLWPLLQVPRSELLALRSSLQRWKAAPGPPNQSFVTAEHTPAHPYLRLYLLGLLSVRLDDHAPALEYAAELERQAGASFAPAFVRGLGRGLQVEVARARGQADQALATLDSAASGAWGELGWREITGNSPFYFQEYQQFVRAELLNTLGRDAEALQAYRGIADYLFHSGGPAHLRLAQIYERRREPQKAAAHYAKFAELWKDCDPEFRPLVEEARRRMAP